MRRKQQQCQPAREVYDHLNRIWHLMLKNYSSIADADWDRWWLMKDLCRWWWQWWRPLVAVLVLYDDVNDFNDVDDDVNDVNHDDLLELCQCCKTLHVTIALWSEAQFHCSQAGNEILDMLPNDKRFDTWICDKCRFSFGSSNITMVRKR